MSQNNSVAHKKEGINNSNNPKTQKNFTDYVYDIQTKLDKFKEYQPFVYTFYSQKLNIAVEMYNAERYVEAWNLYRKIAREIYELMGEFKQPTKRVRYFYNSKSFNKRQ
jgi:hypothetical protein